MAAESRKTPATRTEAPTLLAAGLPALERLLTAAAEWLEGVNDARKEAEGAAEEAAQEAQKALAALPDHSREREQAIQECALGPQSLVGSWFHKFEGGKVAWQGSVVAEPQPGFYLLELHNWKDGSAAHQRVVPLTRMADHEDGHEFRFYDDAEWMRLGGTRGPRYEYVDLQEEVR